MKSNKSVIELFNTALENDIALVLEEDKLRLKAPKGQKIDPRFITQVKDLKGEIMEFLKNEKQDFEELHQGEQKFSPYNRANYELLPLSFPQERLWFVDKFNGSTHYHIPVVLRLKGVLDTAILEETCREVVNRHEVLRTVFKEEEGLPHQIILDKNKWMLATSENAELNTEQEVREFIRAEVNKPFDLSQDHTLRGVLHQFSDDEYLLVFVLHHIAADGWSRSVMVREFTELYQAKKENRAANLPDLNVQYLDYAIWQKENLNDENLTKKLTYWEQKLSGFENLKFPLDFKRPAVQSNRGKSLRFKINKSVSDQLQQIATEEGVTMFMLLLGVYKVLLHRYTGQSDICVGTTVANRPFKEFENLIGFFVNSLALRSDVDKGLSFLDFLKELKSTTLDAYSNIDVPFEKVVDKVVQTRDVSRSPIFQVLFVFNNNPTAPSAEIGEVAMMMEDAGNYISKFDFTLFAKQQADGINITITYCTDMFKSSTMERLAVHFQELLTSVTRQPEACIRDLRMLTATEEEQLFNHFEIPEVDYSSDQTLVDIFTEQVKQKPNKTAFVFEGKQLTYQALDEQSDKLAAYLRQTCEVKPNDLVGIMIPTSEWSLVAILGVLKSGAAYVPIDAELPQERKSFIIKDTEIKCLLIQSDQLFEVLGLGVPAFSLDIQLDDVEVETSVEAPVLSSEDLAYVIYTSGSTGEPKGVMITHGNLLDYTYGLASKVPLSDYNSFGLMSTLTADLGNTVLYGSIFSGGTLHLFSKKSLTDANYLQRYFSENEIDCIKIVPSHWNALEEEGQYLFPHQALIFGGDVLAPDLVEKIHKAHEKLLVVNHYGPTETTVGKLLHILERGRTYNSIPVGRPFSNTKAYVVDESLRLRPLGVPGELILGGAGIAKGYLNRAPLTQEKFIKNPFDSKAEDRFYRTGDLVRQTENGEIEFIGRVDNQVKIRGYRVELGEIEKVLNSFSEVKQGVIIAKEGTEGEKNLIAYVVADESFERSQLDEYFAAQLPVYMRPSIVVTLDEMPLTANGKINKKALPNPSGEQSTSIEYAAPETEMEMQLAEIWANLLGIERVGIDNNFFEMGGHSLLGIRVVSAIRKEFNKEIAITDLFEYMTVRSLAAFVDNLAEAQNFPALEAGSRPDRIPLSYSQERLWFIDKLQGSTNYHIPTVRKIKGALDVEALEAAFQSVINRHEILRTIYIEESGQCYQEVLPKGKWNLEIAERLDVAEDALTDEITAFIEQPFNLSTEHMVRAKLIKQDEEEYTLVLVLHHIASDGWSTPIFVNEVLEYYQAKRNRRAVSLMDLDIQYADYSIWQRSYLQGEYLDQKLAYWETKLGGLEALSLPLDFKRPAIQSTKGNRIGFSINKNTAEQLNALAQKEGLTLFMLLSAAYKVLLHRYSGQEDICIGSPVANRIHASVEPLVGFFINTIPLRSKVKRDEPFRAFLKTLKTTTLEAYKNQDVPFEKIVDRTVSVRDRSQSPIFQTVFVLQNNPEVQTITLDTNASEGITLSSVASTYSSSKFDMTMLLNETAEGLKGTVEYCTDLFLETSVQRMADHYATILEQVANDPDLLIGQIKMLKEQEEQKILQEFNFTPATYPKDKTIVDLFEEQVIANPSAVALDFDGVKMTYETLNAKANQLAHYLRARGVKEEDLVIVCLDRSMEMIVSLLALIKAGGIYVPVDPNYPEDRINYILDDSKAGFILSQEKYSAALDRGNIAWIDLDRHEKEISESPSNNLAIDLSPENGLYVIYTSGSTGKPKGVMVEHRNLVRLFRTTPASYDFGANDVWTMFHSFCFDFSVWEMYGALLHGGRLVIVPSDVAKDAATYATLLHEKGVTVLNQTPGSFYNVQAFYLEKYSETNIRYVIFGGEALAPHHLKEWKTTYPDCKLINMYGITETTVHVTYKEIDVEAIETGISNIGRPIPTLGCYILDEDQNLVPIGVPGEIYVQGDGLARNYLHRPELTQERFIENPFGGSAHTRLYKTGDLARWQSNGDMEFLGRKDSQVKVRGYRIELGEIESVLTKFEQISQGTVLVKEQKEGKILLAYIVPTEGYQKASLQEYLQTKLPAYMIPSMVIELESMPLTSNGKVDKKGLPNPADLDFNAEEYLAPQSELEMQLAKIWQEILELEQVGVNAELFEIGGHSIIAVRIASAIRETLSKEISVADLFKYTTIRKLAIHLEQQAVQTDLIKIGKQDRQEEMPLSFSQERLWFLDKLQGSTNYHIPLVRRIKGTLDAEHLAFAFKSVVNRHEILRTVYGERDGYGFQKVLPENQWILEQVDFSTETSSEVADAFIKEYVEKPFDLATDHMVRACLVKIAADEYVLAVVLHHIASDGWSSPIFINELIAFYQARREQRETNLVELDIQYGDYAVWQRAYLTEEVLEEKLQFWEDQLKDAEVLKLPTDYSRLVIQSTKGERRQFDINPQLAVKLNQLAKEEGVTLFMLLAAAYKVMLHRYTGQEDITIGSPIANRGMAELEPLIGFFVNTIPVRSKVSGDINFRDLLREIKKTTLSAYAHQDIPFEKIVDRMVTERDRSQSPIFQTMLVLQNNPEIRTVTLESSADRTTSLSAEGTDHVTSKYDLTFIFNESEEVLSGAVEYCKDLFLETTIDRMAQHFTAVLNQVTQNSTIRLEEINFLSKEERAQLVETFNDTKKSYPKEKTMVDLFEAQVAKHPNRLAVVFEEQELTYKELNEKSNQLARYLMDTGVQQEDIVAVSMERSMDMIVAIMGVLKAGAAFLPIDVTYPADRIKYILEHSQTRYLLSQSQFNFPNEENDKKTIFVDSERVAIDALDTSNLELDIKPNNLAYVIYTSGSTGRPKGIQIEHSSNVNMGLTQIETFDIIPEDRVMQFASLSFDASVWEIFMAFYSGASLVIVSEETIKEPDAFVRYLNTSKTSIITLPPAYLRILPLDDLSVLRVLITAGEQANLEDALYCSKFLDYYNAYGPSECAVCSTIYKVKGTENELQPIPIGKPISNFQVYVLDKSRCLVPTGVEGDLYIAGAGLARAYLNNETLTDEKFVDNPFTPGAKMYLSGDRAKWDHEGNLIFLGRDDNQVKIRGHRIELGEIETVLNQSELVSQCVVLVKEHESGDKVLVAYVTPENEYDKDGILSYLRNQLPAYMLPSILIDLEALPITPNGKIDKKALPDPTEVEWSKEEYVAPKNETEARLVKIWESILGISKIGITNNFFDLGGHSIMAVRVTSAVKNEFGLSIPIKVLFEFPVIDKLAQYITLMEKKKAEPEATTTEIFDL